jgi:hypothetical protein
MNDNEKYKLYGIYHPVTDELKYVGITVQQLNTRLNNHLRQPTNFLMKTWFKELSSKDLKPIIKLIKNCETYRELLDEEINMIKKCREENKNILNISDGGDINPMYGKTHTLEAKEKISKTHKGKILSEDEIKKRKILLKRLWSDKEWSNKVKEKMSKNMLGNTNLLGYKHSDKTKEKMSNSHKGNNYCIGYKHSEVTKEKMSNNNKGSNNPMYGKSLPKETLIKRSKKVISEGTFKGENNPNFKFKITKVELYDLFITKNMTIKQISEFFGCSKDVINNNLRKYSINKPKSNKYNLNYNDIMKYKSDGLSLVEIGNIYGCSNKIIHKYIKKNKI